jgi:hypothetical protein
VTAPEKGLRFYPASHRYKLDGEWVPGVTTILGQAIPKPGLTKWASKSVAEYVANNRPTVETLYDMGGLPMVEALKNVPWQTRDEAGKRGTEIHELAERYVQGEEVDVPDPLIGHVESAAAFIDDWNIQTVLVEQAVASREHGYAGKLDMIADHNKGPRAVMDWKTGRSGIYFEAAFQLVAYANAEFYGEKGDEHPMADLGIEASYGVHIRADGYDVYPLKFGPAIYQEFLTLLEAARINKRAEGDWKVPGSGYVGVALQSEDVLFA